jgi:hypothetical protein
MCLHATILHVGEDLEDEIDDHCCAAKMGGEPGPTGRANLFDTRKTYDTPRDRGGIIALSFAPRNG